LIRAGIGSGVSSSAAGDQAEQLQLSLEEKNGAGQNLQLRLVQKSGAPQFVMISYTELDG
jgi:hypothetical protein